MEKLLSTPHGALGTSELNMTREFTPGVLSTPHGALGTPLGRENPNRVMWLSTPHGALGTGFHIEGFNQKQKTFNSTRCIRNESER